MSAPDALHQRGDADESRAAHEQGIALTAVLHHFIVALTPKDANEAQKLEAGVQAREATQDLMRQAGGLFPLIDGVLAQRREFSAKNGGINADFSQFTLDVDALTSHASTIGPRDGWVKST